MGTGKRILVAVAVASLLTIAATGCRGTTDDGLRAAGKAVKGAGGAVDALPTPSIKVPKPVSKIFNKLAQERANAVIGAGCQLKDSPDIEQEARQRYGHSYSEFEVGLIVELAETAQTDPDVRAYCD
jgi:hypothetical protein